MRLGAWKPQGCFCDRCLAAFNAKTGGNWTREELAKRLFSNAPREPLRAEWSAFNAESLALYAATVRAAADELESPCRLGYQAISADATYNGPDFRPLLEALSGPEHRPVGMRPGAGYYIEVEPRGMVEKCLSVAREAERCRTGGGSETSPVATVCYEQETYPRHVLHKSPGAIMTECALALASGCDSLSLYWYDHAVPEPIEEYDRFLRTLAEARPYFERLAASTRRTRLGGVARFVGSAASETPGFDLRDKKDFALACAGIPVTVAESGTHVFYLTDKSRAEMTDADKTLLSGCSSLPPPSDTRHSSLVTRHLLLDGGSVPSRRRCLDIEKYPLASRRTKLLDDLDAATGGAFPVRIDECRPLRILPRVLPDGRLDSVTICNLSIGGTDELNVRVRRPVSRRALLQGPKMPSPMPIFCEAGATPDEAIVTLSDIPGWQIVTLFFGEDVDTASADKVRPIAPSREDVAYCEPLRQGSDMGKIFNTAGPFNPNKHSISTAHIYATPPCEERNAAGYAVMVDGAEAPVSAVRNSAMPVNIRWPGHQRDLDQTEIGGLVRFSFEGKAHVEVTAPRDFREVRIRPSSRGVRPVVEGRKISFELTRPGGYSVEFDGIHSNLLVLADAPTDYAVDASDPQTISFGPGAHEAGLIELKSGQTFYIHEDAVVFGRVFARDADGIRILGRGILDGSHIKAEILPIDPALAEEQRRKGFAITNYRRYDAIRLEYCDDVLIDGIVIRDSPLYNIRPICCRGVTIRDVKLCGNWRYNSDGIDMHNCENVRISDCFLRTFDDSICVKGFDYTMDEREMLHDGHLHDVFTNAVIERCTVWCDWGRSLELGAETRAREIRDIVFRDCDVIRCEGPVCDIQNCDYADIHDIAFEDIRIEQDSPVYQHLLSETASVFDPTPRENASPRIFEATVRVIPEYSKNDMRRGRIRYVTLSDIRVTGPDCPQIRLGGYDQDHGTTGVTIRGIYWNGREVSKEVEACQQVASFADPARFVP